MTDRVEVFPHRPRFSMLIDEIAWYDNMPGTLNDVVGDKFGENMDEYFKSKLPPIPECDGDDPSHYIASIGITTHEGKKAIELEIGSQDNFEEEHYTITLV